MGILPSKKMRSGDEHYTPENTVIKYLLPFGLNKNVYTPFGTNSMVKRVLSRYTTVIDTPLKYNGDFFKAMADKDFTNYLKKEKFVILDNPPFSKLSSILSLLTNLKIDYFLFGSSLTALTASSGKIMYLILGSIEFQSKKKVNTCLFSNTFKSIRLFPIVPEKKILLPRGNRGFLTSGNISNMTKKGLVIRKENIISYTDKLFGGAILTNL